MLKRKTKIESKHLLILIGVFFIIGAISMVSFKYYNLYKTNQQETENIEIFFEEQRLNETIEENEEQEEVVEEKKEETKKETINYIAVVEIPKISLKRGLVDKNSWRNNVNQNIQILKESNMPNEDKGNFILAAHSGSSSVSYFKNLHKLVNDDPVYVYYDNAVYTYKIVNKYEIEKTGQAVIKRNMQKQTLTMITCISGTEKQMVVIAELVGKEGY